MDEICDSIIQKLPHCLKIEDLERSHQITKMNSYNSLLLFEVHKYNMLLKVIKRTIVHLKECMEGITIADAENETMQLELKNKSVPSCWKSHSYVNS